MMTRTLVVLATVVFSVAAFGQDEGTTTSISTDNSGNSVQRSQTTTTTTNQTAMKAPEGTGNEKNLLKTGDVGIGAAFGTPNEITVKFWTAEDRAVDINVAYQSNDLDLIADHLWHFRTVFRSSDGKVSPFVPYIGIGAEVVFNTTNSTTTNDNLFRRTNDNSGTEFGARVPIGIEFLPRSFPAGFFAELAPGAIFTPDNFTFLQGDIGARYYF
jgi:hypothetical protein